MPNALPNAPKQNRILAALPVTDYLRLERELEPVTLPQGEVIQNPGDTLNFLYFPTTCVVSRIWTGADGAMTVLALTGNDGLIGIPSVLGGETASHRVVVQSAGQAYRLRAELARWEFDQGGELLHLALLYLHSLTAQIAQTALCHGHHSVTQSLCRWLLLSLDRLQGTRLHMTQDQIAQILGVRRAAVTEAAGKLQAAGVISYSRGTIQVLDRSGLEARACECYAVTRHACDRLLHSVPGVRVRDRLRPHPASLRKYAEELARRSSSDTFETQEDQGASEPDLQVRQIELALQYEELAEAYAEADALRDRYAEIYDFAPVAYVTVDEVGAILQINLAGAVLLGLKRSEITRHRFGASVSPESLPVFERFLEGVLKGGSRQTCEIELLPTEQRPSAIVTLDAVPDEEGRECRMVLSDVTRERQNERTLREREQYQRALLDNFPFMVWLKDDRGRFLSVNRPFADTFGWPSAESLVGKTDFDIATQDLAEAYRADDQAILEGGQGKIVEEWVEHRGERRWSETFKSPVRLDGRIIGTVGFSRDITERKQAERALRLAEERYRLAMDATTDGLWDWNVRTGKVDYSPSWLRILGIGETRAEFDTWNLRIHPEDRARVFTDLEAHLAGNSEQWGTEHRLKTGEGSWKWVLGRGRVVERDEAGRPCRMIGTMTDISERRRVQYALHDSETRLRTLIDALPDLVMAVNEEGRITEFHLPPLESAPCSPPAAVGKNFREVLPPEAADRLAEMLDDVRADDKAHRFDLTLELCGRTYFTDAILCRLMEDDPERKGFLCVARDVTEEKTARARESLLVSALEAVGNGVVITGIQGHIEWANPAFEAMTGYGRGEVLNRRPADLISSGRQDKAFYETMWRTILSGNIWRGELVNLRKDGTPYNAELTIAPVKDETGTIRYFVGIQHNISDRKQLEEELRNLASTDSLTGLPNRRHFLSRLEEELARMRRAQGHSAAVMMLDIDHFKRINDNFGHAAGDAVLRNFAALLSSALRKTDTAGRVGGEEFALLLPNTTLAAARAFAERLRMRVETATGSGEVPVIPITVSIGIASLNATDTDVDLSLAQADEALYRAKHGGRNRVECHP